MITATLLFPTIHRTVLPNSTGGIQFSAMNTLIGAVGITIWLGFAIWLCIFSFVVNKKNRKVVSKRVLTVSLIAATLIGIVFGANFLFTPRSNEAASTVKNWAYKTYDISLTEEQTKTLLFPADPLQISGKVKTIYQGKQVILTDQQYNDSTYLYVDGKQLTGGTP